VIAERAGLLVEDLDDPDRPSEMVLHRDGEDGARAIPRLDVEVRVEPWILVGLVDEERLARLGDVAGDTLADLEPDLTDLITLDDARDELVLPVIEQIEGRAVRLDRVGDLVEDELEELLEIERGAEGEPDLPERDADPAFAGELLVEILQLLLEETNAHVQLARAGSPRGRPGRLSARGRRRAR
jgi:hypothetical protein